MGRMRQVSGWSKSGLEGEAQRSQVITGGGVFISFLPPGYCKHALPRSSHRRGEACRWYTLPLT